MQTCFTLVHGLAALAVCFIWTAGFLCMSVHEYICFIRVHVWWDLMSVSYRLVSPFFQYFQCLSPFFNTFNAWPVSLCPSLVCSFTVLELLFSLVSPCRPVSQRCMDWQLLQSVSYGLQGFYVCQCMSTSVSYGCMSDGTWCLFHTGSSLLSFNTFNASLLSSILLMCDQCPSVPHWYVLLLY